MEGFLMENSPMNVRKSSFGTVNFSSSSYGGFGFNDRSSAQYNYSSQIHPPPSVNQLLLNTNYNSARSLMRGGSTLFSSAPPPAPPPLYSSLPLHRPPHHHQQPPLLPLPLKSASLPEPKAAKAKNQRRKTKKSQQPKPAETTSIKPFQKAVKMAKEADQEEETEEEFLIGSPSSVLSPPPSSLPLPRLLLIKLRSSAKGAAGSCTAEAKAGALDAGATDDLRKLLRL